MFRKLTLILLFVTSNAYAQDREADNSTGEQGKQEQQIPDEATDKQKQAEIVTPDTFDPTEKLSEDIAADFPVDI